MTEQDEEPQEQGQEQKQSIRDAVLSRRLLDSLFKYVFCREERKDVFLDMVNAFVFPEGEGAFKELHFLDREKSPGRAGGKSCRLDALAEADNGTMINMESQVNKKQYFLQGFSSTQAGYIPTNSMKAKGRIKRSLLSTRMRNP